MQMHRVGVSVANIGRRLGLKGKIVRKIVASFGPFGMGMMNANMSKKGDKNSLSKLTRMQKVSQIWISFCI